jgi:hypothetical protein
VAKKSRGTGTYHTVYRELSTRTVKTLRTSIGTDLPDGVLGAACSSAMLDGIRLTPCKKHEDLEPGPDEPAPQCHVRKEAQNELNREEL